MHDRHPDLQHPRERQASPAPQASWIRRYSTEHRDEGFTLIELLVVIIIIGILAAIALPLYLNQKQRAYDAAAKVGMRTLAQFEEAYLSGNSTYADIPALLADSASITPSKGVTITVQYYVSAQAYCLSSKHVNSPVTWWFDSQAGGLLGKTATGCPVTNSSNTPGGVAGTALTG